MSSFMVQGLPVEKAYARRRGAEKGRASQVARGRGNAACHATVISAQHSPVRIGAGEEKHL
jgi:hypothetical protein